MIPVAPQPEPDSFNVRVRVPGLAYLATNPRPTSKQFATHSYWRRILVELHDAYRGICAYSCHWIPHDTGGKTVEHFMAKSHFPNQAYEWSNFRLVCSTLNGRKGTNNILDPFTIDNGWFVIDFPSLLVKPSVGLRDPLAQQVLDTITSLGLNDEGTCLKSRERYIKNYCKNLVDFEYLTQEAPFIAQELERQGLVLDIVTIMDYS